MRTTGRTNFPTRLSAPADFISDSERAARPATIRWISRLLITLCCVLAWGTALPASPYPAASRSCASAVNPTRLAAISFSSVSIYRRIPAKCTHSGRNSDFKRTRYTMSRLGSGSKPLSARTRRLQLSSKLQSPRLTLVSFPSATIPAEASPVRHRLNRGRSPPRI